MGILANHVPSIEQLKPGLVEIIEEAGGSKQFFGMWCLARRRRKDFAYPQTVWNDEHAFKQSILPEPLLTL